MSHAFLALACVALLGTIAAQNYLVPSLRNDTISAGLTGPYHWYLDASYVQLAAALCIAFRHHAAMEALAVVSGVSLLLVAATNTFHVYVDRITGGKHSLWHSRFTLVVFCAALALQMVGDHGWYWLLTALNVAVPGVVYALFHYRKTDVYGTIVKASPAAEKIFVTGLCVWLIAI